MSIYSRQAGEWRAYAHQSIGMMLEADDHWSEEEAAHWANAVADCITNMRRCEELSSASTMVNGYIGV